MSDQDIRDALIIARGQARLGYNLRGKVKSGALQSAVEALVNSIKESPVKSAETKVPAIAKQPEGAANVEPPPAETWKHGVSINKLPIPLEEMRATRVDKNELIPRNFVTPADLEGSVGIPIHGDRTIAGETLTHVMDKPTAYDVNLPGGFDYTRGPAQTGPDKSGWSSEKSAISKMFNQAEAIQKAGKDPIGLSAAMGSQSGDYSAHMADALAAQMPGSKILRRDIKAFDEAMRQHDPNWVGIENPDIRKYLEQARSVRTRMAEEMFGFEDKGFPNVPITRFAITNPELLNAKTGSTGYSIMGIEPQRGIITDPVIPHGTGGLRTYSTDLPATYVGGYKDPLPINVAWSDWWNNLDPKFQDRSKTSQMLRKFRDFDNPTQEFTPEYVDTTMNYLRKTYPDSGYARGGYPEKGEGYDPQAEAEALRVARETNPREEQAMFTGARGARFTPMVEEALRLAEKMMKEGFGKKEILKDTGWFLDQQGMPKDYRGATNNPQWKTEINDLDASLKMSPEEFAGKFVKLPEILHHPELFETVPSMEKVMVGPGNIRGAYRGYFDKHMNAIGMRGGMDPDLFLSTLLHEGQHGLQKATGLMGGGNPARMSHFTDNTMQAMNRELALKVANELHSRGWEPWGSNIDNLRPSLVESDPRYAVRSGWGRYIDEAFKADPAEHAAQTEAIRAKNFGSETGVDAYKRIGGENEAYNVEERLKQGITKDQMRDIHPEDTALHPFDQTFQQSPQ